jgi:HlyD family secretion protein
VRTRTLVIGIAIVVAVVCAGGAALALSSSDGHGYRTATAVTGTVTRELHGAGTIQPVSQATVAFPIAGTVAAVNVKLGQEVAIGTTLATLDTAALESTVLAKKAALASAQLNLEKALNGEAVTGGRGGNGGNSTTPTTNAVTTAVVSTNTGDAAKAVVAAQHEVDIAMNAVNTALAAASTACGQAGVKPPNGGGGPHGGRGPGSAAASTTTTTTPSQTPDTGIGTVACQRAQQTLFQAQQDLAAKQQALGHAENAYSQALQSGSGRNDRSESGGNGNTGGNGSNGSSAVTYSAQQLIAYQAAVDAAAAQVTAAEEAVAQATIESPIIGTVVGLSLHAGQQVTAGSSTANVVIAGANGYEVSTSVGVNDIAPVKVGDSASVVPDGSLQSIAGKVVYIGSPSSSGTSTTYPVVIGLTGDTSGLRNGAMATTTIQTATSKKTAVLVPTSAVHNAAGRKTVTVLNGGKATTVAVEVGVVGAQQTEITSGVTAGQTVALADLGQAVPSSSADSRIASQFGSGLTGGNGNRTNARGG